MSASRKDINFVNVIIELGKAGRSNKDELIKILYRNEIPKIESLERRVLGYIYELSDENLRCEFIDILAEANNLPIIHECNSIIYSGLPKEEYIAGQAKNKISKRDSIKLRYEKCMEVMELSSYLQEKLNSINEYKTSIDPEYIGMKVRSHKGRRRASTWGHP